MRGRLIVVTGTGTGIGKTRVSCATLTCAGRTTQVFGYKPIESGVEDGLPTDAMALAHASTFHVQHPVELRLKAAVSPHLAARWEQRTLDWEGITKLVSEVRALGVHTLIELPGGLFTPLAPGLRNAEAVHALAADITVLLAPDRLGVLHDVGAVVEAAHHRGIALSAIGLVTPETPDASTGTNAQELATLVDVPILGTWPRDTVEALTNAPATRTLTASWLGNA